MFELNRTQTDLNTGAADVPADRAVIRIDQLKALAGLLSIEDVAEEFARMDTADQVAIFGLLEDTLSDIRGAVVQSMEAAIVH